jgi:oligoribonuclease NrnB/cAMP/cGMP phosphodiesterase (DHH superfamily)
MGQILAPVRPGDDVYMADICFPYDVLRTLEACRKVTILDHHVTAEPIMAQARDTLGMETHYDVQRSGAVITWDFFHPDTPAPMLLRHVQDRDLWQFKLENTKPVMEALGAHGDDFEVWHRYATHEDDYRTLISEGTLLLRSKMATVNHLLNNARFVVVAGFKVPAVNTPIYNSDIANLLLERFPDAPFAACYHDAEGIRRWSLRSRKNGTKVSQIASLFGGGGHDQASGFAHPLPPTEATPQPPPP